MLLMVLINLGLMLFNLIPVPPLDGHHLLYPFLPYNGQQMMERIGPFGIIIAIVLANRILPGPLEALKDGVLWFAFWGRG
jgi:Zn-dependent protease